MSAYATAVAALRRAAALLAASDLTPEERRNALALHGDALQLLATAADRRRLPSRALAERVAQLERQLADRPAGERRAIVCARLGLGRSRYYELRRESGKERTDN